MTLVKVRVRLKCPRSLNHTEVVSGARDELDSDGQVFIGETARDRQRWQSAQISNCAKRIGKRQSRLQIKIERGCGDRLRNRCDHIEGIKKIRHLPLQLLANLRCLPVVG